MIDQSISNADIEFLTDILQKFYRFLFSVAEKCGPPGESEDIVADTAIYLMKHIDLLRSLTSAQQSVYLYKVVQHTAYNRGTKYRHFRSSIKSKDDYVDDFTVKVENRAILESVLGKLKQQYRDILLFHFWGYSIKEIAEIMGMRPGTAGVYLQRARLQARKLLDDWKEE